MISKADKYLAGWKAALLNTMGRAVLADAVLGNLLIYAMGAIELPKGTIEALDSRRRAFVWSGQDKVSGAQCLVAWDSVCLPKELGGLGLKNLATQKQCLLLKLIHRLHNPGASSWARWARQRICLATLTGELQGPHWKSLQELLPLYRAITTVDVHNGASTSFWEDCWLQDHRLSEAFPALYSHATKPAATVSDVLQCGLDQHLRSRRTRAASTERAQLLTLLQPAQLTVAEDTRISMFQDTDGRLNTALLYKTLMAANNPEKEMTHVTTRSGITAKIYSSS